MCILQWRIYYFVKSKSQVALVSPSREFATFFHAKKYITTIVVDDDIVLQQKSEICSVNSFYFPLFVPSRIFRQPNVLVTYFKR